MSAMAPGLLDRAPLAAIRLADIGWAFLVALAVWALGWVVLSRLARRGDAAERLLEGRRPAPEPVGSHAAGPVPEGEGISGVLRWLLSETEADAAAFLRLAPGGGERFVIEPRGLDPSDVRDLAKVGRDALVVGEDPEARGVIAARWLGGGGSKVLVLRGSHHDRADEPLRLARFAIEWMGSAQADPSSSGLESRIRSIPGVAWAETNGSRGGEVRVLAAEDADREMVEERIRTALGDQGVEVKWMERAEEAPGRARLVAVELDGDNQAAARVALDWQGQELRGLGYGTPSQAGRCQAAALAVADALGPLIAGNVEIENVYTQASAGHELVVAVVLVDGKRLVGAVPVAGIDDGAGGARAVLDAVNRKLSLMAGGSGRL